MAERFRSTHPAVRKGIPVVLPEGDMGIWVSGKVRGEIVDRVWRVFRDGPREMMVPVVGLDPTECEIFDGKIH